MVTCAYHLYEARVVVLILIQDREKALGRMTRQYAFALRLKRAGCGLMPDGVSKAQSAQLTVRCWACPRIGYNLPEGWTALSDDEK